MSDTYHIMSLITQRAKQDDKLRERILRTADSNDSLNDFCKIAQEEGFDISVGDILTIGEEYSDNQCKSTNGGNPNPYDYFDDPYEMLLASLE